MLKWRDEKQNNFHVRNIHADVTYMSSKKEPWGWKTEEVVQLVEIIKYLQGAILLNSGGASIEGARAPPLLEFWDEKKKKKKKIHPVKKHDMPNYLKSKYTVLTR